MQKNSGSTATSRTEKTEASVCVLFPPFSNSFLRGKECRSLDSTTKQAMWQSLLNSSSISEA